MCEACLGSEQTVGLYKTRRCEDLTTTSTVVVQTRIRGILVCQTGQCQETVPAMQAGAVAVFRKADLFDRKG